MADETTAVNAEQKETIFVNLCKNVYEKWGRKLISYKPTTKTDKTYPVGLGRYDDTIEDGKTIKMYDDKYWLSLAVNEKTEDSRWDLVVSLNKVNTEIWKKYFLFKKVKDWKTSFGCEKPVDIGWTSYWMNLYQNTKTPEKKHDMLLVFTAADATNSSGGSEAEITFDAMDF